MLSDNLAPIISPHPGKVLPGAVLPVYPMLESLSRKSDGIEHGSVRRRNYTVLEPLRAISVISSQTVAESRESVVTVRA